MDLNIRSHFLPRNLKEWFAVAAAIAALTYLFGNDIKVQIELVRARFRDSMRDNVSIEYEVERARQSVASLIPDICRNHELIVREQVEIEELRREIQSDQRGLNTDRDALLALRSNLGETDRNNTRLASNGNGLASNDARHAMRKELQERFSAYQSAEAALAAKRQLVEIRETSLTRAKLAQNEILQKKRSLDAEIVHLEARLKVIQASGVDNQVRVNRDKMADTEELVRYLRKRLAIAERLTDPEAASPEFRTAELASGGDDIETEIDQYFVDSKRNQ
jgi:hypothetical protein